MPSAAEMRQFLTGQIFQTPPVPTGNVKGKCYIITGANTGLGYEAAQRLASMGASRIVLACRNQTKGEAARAAILASHATSSLIEIWQVDLCSFQSVVAFAKRVQTELPRLDGFLANAGIDTLKYSEVEGYESTIAVNVVSTFLMAVLLLPKLRQTATSCRTDTVLTFLGSSIHIFAPHEQLQGQGPQSILKTLSDVNTAAMDQRYFLSKLIVHLCFHPFAERTALVNGKESHKVVVNCVNPGWCKTELFRTDDGGLGGRIGLRLIGRTAEQGARCLVHAVTTGGDTHERYLSECHAKAESGFVNSKEGRLVQQSLWKELSELVDSVCPGAMKDAQLV